MKPLIDPDLYELYVLDCRLQELKRNGLPHQEEAALYADMVLAYSEKVMQKAYAVCKDIEKHGELVFNAQQLPFEAWNPEQVASTLDSN